MDALQPAKEDLHRMAWEQGYEQGQKDAERRPQTHEERLADALDAARDWRYGRARTLEILTVIARVNRSL